MTLRYIVLLSIVAFLSFSSNAQTYYPITATNGQFQLLGGTLVQANRTGFGFCQGKYLASPGFCGVSPYYIGDCGRNGWRYSFAPPATDIRIHMTSLNDNDSIRISIPNPSGPPTVIVMTGANLTAWASSCTPTNFAAIPTAQGYITATGVPTGFSDVQIDFQNPFPPYTISNIQVEHMRSPFNNTPDGVVYDIAFADDSCHLRLDATVDNPQCTGKPILLHGTDFPNTTHYWVFRSGPWTGTGANPVIPNATIGMNGFYVDSAVRGACTYKDSVTVFVDLTPVITTAGQKGPKCPGDNDTLSVSSTQATYQWFGPNNFFSGQPDPVIPNIQNTDEGVYYVFAKSITNGCISDTVAVHVKVNEPAVAKFDYDVLYGCKEDTIVFKNQSSNASNAAWDFGDGNSSTAHSPTHIYVSPVMPAFYTVKLKVGNGNCSDELIENVVIDHPLKADFEIDDDSICQHTAVNLKNKSVVAPATIPNYEWIMQDGGLYNFIDVTHTYDVSGVYNLTLIVTDYLGCKDTMNRIVVVDSLGSINYGQTDNSICLGKTILFDGYFSPWGVNKTTWNFGDGTIIENKSKFPYTYDKPGTYNVTFAADYRICPDVVFEQEIIVKPHPVIDLGPDRSLCPNTHPIQLKDKINADNPNAKWYWNSEAINNTSSMMVYHPGTYSATVEIDGCESVDEVEVVKDCYINIPNAFTPNGDGNDDYFLPKELLSKGLTRLNMTVFNRWGQAVFKSNSVDGRGWDGKYNNEPQPMGVYVYIIEASFLNDVSEKYQGNVTLVR